MDLLASLHLDGELPEQQTIISHLGDALAEESNLRLGFNACCRCAKKDVSIECKGCHRVKYCSTACRQEDANLGSSAVVSEEEDPAMGHSSVICALLRLCQADEDADEGPTFSAGNEAAQNRVQSEYESYPATLANVLLDGPCYKSMLARCSHKQLVIHVIGASVEAELWGRTSLEALNVVWDAYADALQELAETNGLQVIRLCMIGPDCPSKPVTTERRMPYSRKQGSSCRLVISTHKKKYSRKLFQQQDEPLPKPDVVCFFNPGFTCPDYDWKETIASLEYGTAFIITTNTEMEGIGDVQFLLDKKMLSSLPPVAAEIIGNDDLVDEESEIVFGENPFAGSRVRQSGTMANDLFVKNRWLLAGVFDKPRDKSLSKEAAKASEERPAKKTKREQNDKRSNPALI